MRTKTWLPRVLTVTASGWLSHVGGHVDDFQFALQTYKPGDVVVVKFVRDGEDHETRVTLSTRGQQ